MAQTIPDGQIWLVDKPYEWTSFDVVGRIRGALRTAYNVKKIKVGHAGTLDPLATGLMIVCSGKMTKQIESIMADEKEYIATIELGKTTPSFDKETQIDSEKPTTDITTEKVQEALNKLKGIMLQIPPTYSAKMVEGKRAYDIARQGNQLVLKPVEIEIKNLELIRFENPMLEIHVVCSKGTYIRSLVRDIGILLGCGAYLTQLKRTRSGSFRIEEAQTPKNIINEIRKNAGLPEIQEKEIHQIKRYNRHEVIPV